MSRCVNIAITTLIDHSPVFVTELMNKGYTVKPWNKACPLWKDVHNGPGGMILFRLEIDGEDLTFENVEDVINEIIVKNKINYFSCILSGGNGPTDARWIRGKFFETEVQKPIELGPYRTGASV
jgi:hypothetical protein